MAVKIDIKIDGALDFLTKAAKQMPFIESLAINNTTVLAQKAQRDHMHEAFADRRPKFTDINVKIKPFANKRSLVAVIQIEPPGRAFDVFGKFEAGGRITSHTGGPRLVPTSTVLPDPKGIIRKARRPRALKESGETFIFEVRSGKEFIVDRVGADLQFLYQIVPSVQIEPDLEFVKTIQKTVFDNFEDEFNKAYQKVLG